jgi:hypothetical protein
MSEFSLSYQLRSGDSAEAVRLIEAADARGFVFPPAGGWVAFVVGGIADDVVDGIARDTRDIPAEVKKYIALTAARDAMCARVERASTTTLLRYSFAPDHACQVLLFSQGQRVGVLSTEFGQQWTFDQAAFISHGVLTAQACAAVVAWLETAATFHQRQTRLLQSILDCKDDDQRSIIEDGYLADRYLVAQQLGLTQYTWLQFDSELDVHDSVGRIAVRLAGRT